MTLQLILTLMLLVQQLALPLAVGAQPRDACCCEVVAITTCCGETIREMRCGTTGGECVCTRADDSGPMPAVPRPQERHDVGPVFVAVVSGAIDLPAAVRAAPRWTPPVIHRTHNETQALLCIWRT